MKPLKLFEQPNLKLETKYIKKNIWICDHVLLMYLQKINVNKYIELYKYLIQLIVDNFNNKYLNNNTTLNKYLQ